MQYSLKQLFADSSKKTGVDNSLYSFAKELYTGSFPVNERRDFDIALQLQHSFPVYFYAICLNDSSLGILVKWTFPEFDYIEHFSILPLLRGQGHGSEILKSVLFDNSKQFVLEVEKPETEEARKRIQFYQKLGLYLNSEFDYVQPPYSKEKDSVPMLIMSKHKIGLSDFETIKTTLYKQVYTYE